MTRQNKLTGIGRAASSMVSAAFHLVRRAVASLGVWLLPIIVGALTAAALSGSLSLHKGSGPDPDRDQVVVDGEKPFSVIDLYYSDDFITVVKDAHRDRHDILANVQALDSAWTATSPAMPLTIELFSSVSSDPITGRLPAPELRAKAVIDETNFQELRPILEDLRELILDGDGTGSGQLRRSGYQAQPANAGKNFWAGSRNAKSDTINRGPARIAPGPATL